MDSEQYNALMASLDELLVWAKVVAIATGWIAGHSIWRNVFDGFKQRNWI